MECIQFEWDENKNHINQNKHNISFEEAKTVFFDYFKAQSEQVGIPYQTLINLYLRDCASNKRQIHVMWDNESERGA